MGWNGTGRDSPVGHRRRESLAKFCPGLVRLTDFCPGLDPTGHKEFRADRDSCFPRDIHKLDYVKF